MRILCGFVFLFLLGFSNVEFASADKPAEAGGSCGEVAKGFGLLLDACMQNGTAGRCINEHWPEFKKANPSCYYAAMEHCLKACAKGSSGSTCASTCK